MRFYKWGFILVLVLASLIGKVRAKDDDLKQYYRIPSSRSITRVAFDFDICIDDLVRANPGLFGAINSHRTYSELLDAIDYDWLQLSKDAILVIPSHEPCHRIVYDPLFSPYTYIEGTYNVCMEEVMDVNIRRQKEVAIYFFRKDAPPCFNAQGQRLEYHDTYWKRLPEPYYKAMAYGMPPENICPGDLIGINPRLYPPLKSYVYFPEYYRLHLENPHLLPDHLRLCQKIEVDDSLTLYDISKAFNVCMDVILDAGGLPFIPLDMPPCYNADGTRIGHNDIGLHAFQPNDEFLLDVARQYDICLQDLWDNNSALNYWWGWGGKTTKLLFIPDSSPCDEDPITFIAQPYHSLESVSNLTNVCMKRLIEANTQYPKLNDIGLMDEFGETLTLTIPNSVPCYDLKGGYINPYGRIGGGIITYICTSVSVTEEMDLTGHIPPVTSSYDTSLPFCVRRTLYMTVYHENSAYTLYKTRGTESPVVIGQCFGINPYELYKLNSQEFPEAVKPSGTMLIPQPHKQNCWMLNVDDETYYKRYWELTYKAGYLIDGVYRVNYGDTLSSIGRKFGYLPQWIAEANNLSDPHTIYYLQELNLPSYPSLYTLVPIGGAVGVIVLASSAIYGLRRWMRSRARNKRKNG